jgi:hypothetical protein
MSTTRPILRPERLGPCTCLSASEYRMELDKEARAEFGLHFRATTANEPFPDFRRGLRKEVEHGSSGSEPHRKRLYPQPNHKALYRPRRILEIHPERRVWPVRPVAHQDQACVQKHSCNREEFENSQKQDIHDGARAYAPSPPELNRSNLLDSRRRERIPGRVNLITQGREFVHQNFIRACFYF